MHVFVTGGAGYIGQAVVRELISAGHRVTALVRRPEQQAFIRTLSAVPVLGDLDEPDRFSEQANTADAIVHLAAPTGSDRAVKGRAALDILLDAARNGNVRHFVYTSVLFVLGNTAEGAAEDSPTVQGLYAPERASFEADVLMSSGPGLVTTVIRPGMVYGGGSGGTVSELFRGALEEGAPTYIGDGRNRWPLVYRGDVARLFRLVIEKQSGGIYHAVDDEPLPVRQVADLITQITGTGHPAKNISLEDARTFLGAFADALCLDQPVTAARARALGWSPRWLSFRQGAGLAFDEWRREVHA